MLMTNENVRLFPHDKVFAKTFLRLIPSFVSPNHLTVLRLFMIPPVLVALWKEYWIASLILFLLASFTDALDGSVARVRKQITLWGTMADPIADKLLVGSVVLLFVAREVNPIFAGFIILIEIMIAGGAIYRKRRGIMSSANEFGKIKMFLQVTGVAVLLAAKLFGMPTAVPFAVGTLSVAIVFAIVSLFTYGI